MSERTNHITPDAPRDLKAFIKDSPLFRFTLRRVVRTEQEVNTAIEDAVRGFAEYLARTASPKGTVQREKLQSFATEFLASLSDTQQETRK